MCMNNGPTFRETHFYSFAEDVKEVIPEDIFKQSIERFEEQRKSLPNQMDRVLSIWIFARQI